MMSKKVHFWLYKGDVRVTGLYGLFYQFTDEPKEYTYSKEQVKIVLGNLENKIERLAAEAKEPFCKGIVQRGELTHSEALSLADVFHESHSRKEFQESWKRDQKVEVTVYIYS